uniref:Uncharacterized protein n=1 Tax=Candidatus Nitrotoga fabula TaxID=2182327 RepID=A0A2X0QSV5_9PROT|nr:protein of unknown function [Candidatus Nitrotoga fabula]
MENLNALADHLDNLIPFVQDPEEASRFEEDSADVIFARKHRVSVSDQNLQSLVTALRSVPIFRELEGGIANHSPSDKASISLDSIAHWLLAQARTRPSMDCVGELMAVIEKNESPLLEIVPVWGISPRVSINLGEGMKIVPIQDLPPSRLKDLFTGKKRHSYSFDIANSFAQPGAAIVKETVHGPLYETSTSNAGRANSPPCELILSALMNPGETGRQAAFAEATQKMMDGPFKMERKSTSIYNSAEELAMVVALCTDRPIFPLGCWYQRPDIDLPLVGTICGYTGPTNDKPFYIAIDQQDYPVNEIEDLVRRYQLLDLNTRKRLKTPLSRLNQGRRQRVHHSLEAAAIDFGIAVEALLTQDRDQDAPISYLLRLRGTLLLKGTPEEKRYNYNVLKDLYKLRSKVAHGELIIDRTSIPRSEKDQDRIHKSSNTVCLGEQVCIKLIRKIIEEGQYPNWDKLMLDRV